MKTITFTLMLLVSGLSQADDLFKSADLTAGQSLVKQNCINCHAASFGGDGSEIYTRELRKVKTQSGLLTQVRNCSTMLDLKWFDEDEVNVAAYLNKTYYHY